MARVTVEDCIERVPNRFELVMMASKRAKDLERGAMPSIPQDNDKSTILALREIAEETISLDGLRELARRSAYDGDNSDIAYEDVTKTVEELMQEPDNPGMPDPEDDEDIELSAEDMKALDDLDDALTETKSEEEDAEDGEDEGDDDYEASDEDADEEEFDDL